MSSTGISPSSASPADAIKASCASTVSCSPDVLAQLRDLLNPPATATSKAKASTTTKPTKTTKTTKVLTNASGKGNKVTKAPNTATKSTGIVVPCKAVLTAQERKKLATEIVNVTLKTLSSALKSTNSASTPSPQPPAKDAPQQTAAKSKKPTATKSTISASKKTSLGGDQYVAECCRVAISFLHDSSKESATTRPDNLAIETAHANLIAKLLSLSMYETTLKEIGLLKRRLVNSSAKTESTSKKDTSILSLFDWRDASIEDAAVPLVVTCQLHFLRVLSSAKKSETILKAIDYLGFTNSPEQLIKRQSTISLPKAIKNLETLAGVLTACGQILSSSTGGDAARPYIVFQFHVRSIECTLSAAELQDEGTRRKTLSIALEMVFRCLNSLSRKISPDILKVYYPSMKQQIEDLLSRLAPLKGSDNEGPISSKFNEIYRLLTNFAQEAGFCEDGLQWNQASLESLGGKPISNASRAAAILRSGTLTLKQFNASPVCEESTLARITAALDALKAPISGSIEDTDRFIQEVLLLRRGAVTITANTKVDNAEVTDICRNIVFATVVFYRKCRMAGLLLAPNSSKAEKVALSAVECAVAIIKTTLDTTKPDSWEYADQRLQECYALAKVSMDNPDEAQPSGALIFERVASAYAYIASLYKREKETKLAQSIAAMKRCVRILQDRPTAERIAANIVDKLDRLANYYFMDGNISRAEEHAELCLSAMVECNYFDSGSGFSLQNPSDSNAPMISKALSLRMRCAVQLGRTQSMWDNEVLDKDIRGKVLEFQIKIVLGLSDRSAKQSASSGVRYILDNIYTIETPIRRARVISQFLALAMDNPDCITFDEAQKLGRDATKALISADGSLNLDEHLAPQYNYVKATLLVNLGLLHFAQGIQKLEYIQLGLDILLPIVNSCKTEKDLLVRIDDPNAFDKMLCTIIDLLEVKGHGSLRVKAIKAIISVCELTCKTSNDEWIKWQTILGLQYHRIGHSGKAGMALAKAEVRMNKDSDVQDEIKLKWHLAYSEYLAGIGNTEKGLETFTKAANIFDLETFVKNSSGSSLRKKISVRSLVANACYVLSVLLFEHGDSDEALRYAIRAVKLMQRVWTNLESSNNRPDNDQMTTLTKGFEALTTKESDKPKIQSMTVAALRGPPLWPAVQTLYSCMAHLSAIYSHQGMSRLADHYMKEALNIAQAVEAVPTLIHALALLGDLKVKQGLLEDGNLLFQKACKLREGFQEHVTELVTLDLTLGDFHRRNEAWENEKELYEQAEGTLTALMNELRSNTDEVESLTESMKQLSTTEEPPATKSRARKAPAKPTRTKSVSKRATVTKAVAAAKEPVKAQVKDESGLLSRLKGDLLRRKALNQAIQNESDLADSLLKQAAELPGGTREIVSQHLTTARSLLLNAQVAIDSDRTFCVLQESAVAIPSILAARLPPVAPAKPKKGRSKKEAVETVEASNPIVDLLVNARDQLMAVQEVATSHCASTMALETTTLITSIMVLISAISPERAEVPGLLAYYSEKNRSLASDRERRAVAMEKEEAGVKDDLSWPVFSKKSSRTEYMQYANFQEDYIDIIPSRWAAVSITLGESRKELLITKYQSGQAPFMLRLPFERHIFHDIEEELGFEEVANELREIQADANSSTHAAKTKTTKAARAEWWKERMELDERLGDLLGAVESKWLCGFKGILSQGPRYNDLMGKFAASFTKILNKHLPSRRKKGSKANNVNLDPRILELFLTVGDPRDEEVDLEQPLQDLVEFVVDILKFNGEENAADEIEMDHLIVDITEALKTYHELCSKSSNEPDVMVDHTILILDKAVQMFPWESLPCLSECSVSRLPSLASLRERLLMESMSNSDDCQGYMVQKTSGCYMLNPSNDLVATQKMFKDELAGLENWDGIVQRPPGEEEFKSALENKDIVMYFGHGSGGQYIPARTVKKLDRCAVTLLLGCSSGALKEAGDFEPYGMAVNYLHAGCPALVGNLWDITDKDIDKFTMVTLQKWGLIPDDDEEEEESQSKMSLTAAVVEGRKTCKLRYLNGAAPIVYGIPTYIS